MYAISARKIAGYVCLPGIIPRLKAFGAAGFGFIASVIASLYVMVRILPENHPYNNPRNIGKFGIRHVIAEAANHIVFSRRNIDQIFIFFVSIAGLILLAIQFLLLLYTIVVGSANAASYVGLFQTQEPKDDIAYNLLDQVFGVPHFFCNTNGDCTKIQNELPWPFHAAMHTMFEFYSLAMLLFAVVIFLYHVVVVVGETALSGTPFGRRFNHIWAPLRLVIAVGALVPLNYGLNSAQYIVLTAAKYGSSVATNGWLEYNRAAAAVLTNHYQPTGEEVEHLVAFPNAPDIQPLVTFMTVAITCRESYLENERIEIKPYLVQYPDKKVVVDAGYDFQAALDFYKKGDVVIRFGEHNDRYTDQKGRVFPYCGELIVHASEINGQAGAMDMQKAYFKLALEMWWSDPQMKSFGQAMTWAHDQYNDTHNGCDVSPPLHFQNPSCPAIFKPPLAAWRQERINHYQVEFETALRNAWQKMKDSDIFDINDEILKRGWGGAGIWYNKIAQMNGAWITTVQMIPSPGKYPSVMEKVMNARRGHDPDASGIDVFNPYLSQGQAITWDNAEFYIARALYETMYYLFRDDPNQAQNDMSADSNVAKNVMNFLFGTYSLFNIRNDENQLVHPLVLLTSVGKGMVDSAIRNLGFAVAFAVGGGMLAAMDSSMKGIADAMSGFFLSISLIGLTAGLVLYYILPFLPFMYFYFAVAAWVKTVFEAIVGVPLWALAHLRIDGKGFPGDHASNGYFLIFEIFVRPILTVFGLLAGISIFAAQARVLHDLFDLVVNNLTGFDDRSATVAGKIATDRAAPSDVSIVPGLIYMKRDIVDEFFFTIVYTIIIYMMATASFKLIDMIPNYILRWIGSGVSTFADSRDDPTENLIRYAAIGGASVGSQVGSGLTQMGRAMGMTVGSVLGSGKGGGTVAGSPPAKGGSTP